MIAILVGLLPVVWEEQDIYTIRQAIIFLTLELAAGVGSVCLALGYS